MGVQSQILLGKSKEGVFRSGEAVVGAIKYSINKPTQFSSVNISFIGKGSCRWSETESDDNTTYNRNKEEYVTLYKYVQPESSVQPGEHHIPFEFVLPEDLPTSMKDNFCKIEYKVKVKFVKANLFNTEDKFDAVIPVYGYVNPCSPEPLTFGVHKKLFSITSNKKVEVTGEIERTFLAPGENITLRLQITNGTDLPIRIRSELIKYFTYISDRDRKNIVKDTVKATTTHSPSLKENSVSNWTCIVPTLPSLYSIQHTKILTGEYQVKVTIEVPFPHINASVEVPVVIGERRGHLEAGVAYLEHAECLSPEKESKLKDENNGNNSKDYGLNWDNLKFH